MAKKRFNKRTDKPGSGRRNDNARNMDRDESRYSSDNRGKSKASFDNDIAWYSKYPMLLQAAASVPYPIRPGMTINFGRTGDPTNTSRKFGSANATIPGVMVLDWVPAIGNSASNTDPASVVAREVYARVRKAYAGTLTVDAPDYVMYFMALDSVFAYIAALKRIYRLLTAWTPENHVIPDTVLRALGMDATVITTLRNERTILWQGINELVLQARKFNCPAVFDYFNRHYWMSDNVYTDAQSMNSQFYVFNLVGCYKFQLVKTPDNVDAGGVVMQPTPWREFGSTNPSITAVSLCSYGVDLIRALADWDDSYTISGYLARAFEGSPTFIVDELPQDQPFNPVYSEEVLTQIENSRVLPDGESNMSLGNGSLLFGDQAMTTISQDPSTNAILADYTMSFITGSAMMNAVHAGIFEIDPLINLRTDQPNPADTVIASRLLCSWKVVSATTGSVTVKLDVGSEIPVRWRIFGVQSPISGAYIPYPSLDGFMDVVTGTDEGPSPAQLIAASQVEMFDWHPFSIFGYAIGTDTEGSIILVIRGDVHNANSISSDTLENIHRICLYSEFNSFSIYN